MSSPRIELPPNLEIIYGKNAVMEALRAGKRVRRLFIAQGAVKDEAVQEMEIGRAHV